MVRPERQIGELGQERRSCQGFDSFIPKLSVVEIEGNEPAHEGRAYEGLNRGIAQVVIMTEVECGQLCQMRRINQCLYSQ